VEKGIKVGMDIQASLDLSSYFFFPFIFHLPILIPE